MLLALECVTKNDNSRRECAGKRWGAEWRSVGRRLDFRVGSPAH
jgi:hypothetical protein